MTILKFLVFMFGLETKYLMGEGDANFSRFSHFLLEKLEHLHNTNHQYFHENFTLFEKIGSLGNLLPSAAINDCCLTHDKCYTDQLGQKYCDDTFCNCLEVDI